MAAPCYYFYVYLFLINCLLCASLRQLNFKELLIELRTTCFLGTVGTVNNEVADLLTQVSDIYGSEITVGIARLSDKEFPQKWTPIQKLASGNVFVLRKMVPDRKCLIKPPLPDYPIPDIFEGSLSLVNLVSFVNSVCETFKTHTGSTSIAGLHRNDILSNLFTLKGSNANNIGHIFSEAASKSFCSRDDIECGSKQTEFNFHGATVGTESKQLDINKELIRKCDRVSINDVSRDEFFHTYVKRSRPVIFTDATRNWTAFSKWTTQFFKDRFGNHSVHVKLTPLGDFEGVEDINLWADYATDVIPDEVKRQLPYPDLVVVRPAGVNMKFSEFLDVIDWASSQEKRNVSAYLEYSSIADHLPGLEDDIHHFSFAASLLTKRHLNIWLSDGYTLGRLHFDPYDNLLCQLRGRKQVIMFEPFDNSQLYEAHIRQAELSYNSTTHSFSRTHLQDSTSMVMSPVDLSKPDFERFAKFAEAVPLNCTIDEGEVLYMPSYWWHEVYSWPNVAEKRNLAVNFWYEPFLTKEFPCQECKMDVNPHYYHLL